MSSLVESSDRAQAMGPNIPVMTVVVFLLVLVVAGQVFAAIGSEEELKNELCVSGVGEGATWVNDSDESLDCRTENGTVVEDVQVDTGGPVAFDLKTFLTVTGVVFGTSALMGVAMRYRDDE